MLTAYIDDSGDKLPNTLVLGGFIAPARIWEQFTPAWETLLAKPPVLKRWKSSEVPAGYAFDQKGLDLAKLISSFGEGIGTVTFLVDRQQYGDIVQNRLGSKADHPYTFGFYQIIVGLLHRLHNKGVEEKLLFVFDDQGAIGRKTLEYFEQAFWVLRPEHQKLVSRVPLFSTDDESIPLQAADMWAYQVFNRWRDAKLASYVGNEMPEQTAIYKELDKHTAFGECFTRAKLENHVTLMERGIQLLARRPDAWDEVWGIAGDELLHRLTKRQRENHHEKHQK